MIPERKISATILDFGEPLLSRFDGVPPFEALRDALNIVIVVWNAHVMAMPLWNHPEHLHELARVLNREITPREMFPILDQLAKRRFEKFADDPRVVGKWELVTDDRYGYRLICDARLPANVMRQSSGALSPQEGL